MRYNFSRFDVGATKIYKLNIVTYIKYLQMLIKFKGRANAP